MADRDDTLLPLPGWVDVLEQLSLPLRAYQQQIMRTYEPALRFGEKFWQSYGGWLCYWERFVYWERIVAVEGAAFEVPDWTAEEGTSASPTAITRDGGRPALTIRGAGPGQLHAARRSGPSAASRRAVEVDVPPDAERCLADLAGVLEVVRAQFEHLMSSLNGMLDEQLKLLVEVVAHSGPPGQEKQAED